MKLREIIKDIVEDLAMDKDDIIPMVFSILLIGGIIALFHYLTTP